jgi:uncharacterized membrane protein
MELLERAGLAFTFRWLHVLVGIAWIGLLYYFNFVQVPALAAYGDEGKARNLTLVNVASRALWWFRWASVATLATGILITGAIKNYFEDFMSKEPAYNSTIAVGMILGITMAANVWMIIWKNQKVVLANAANVLNGQEADPNAAAAGRRALLASRQNMIFSVSMLFFMVGAAHFYINFPTQGIGSSQAWLFLGIAVGISALLQLNCLGLFGGTANTNKLLWPYENHKNAIITSFVLWAVLWILSEIILG